MNLVYGVNDKPKFGQLLIFAFQQVLAILAATILVPSLLMAIAISWQSSLRAPA